MMRFSIWSASLALLGLLAGSTVALGQEPLALHPQNPHYFAFRGKPTILVTSGEHYGAVLNLDFDFIPYLKELQRHGFNLTRVFSGTYREVPGSFKIDSNTLAPKPGRFIGPYARTNQPGAADGGNKFDLDTWNPDYFARLRTFVSEASKRGIVVEFVLFCPFYEDILWDVNAWNPKNNINKSPDIAKTAVYTLKHPVMVERQLAFVRKVVGELKNFDNLYFEICNEPYFGGVTLDWQAKVAETIADVEKDLPRKHLIAQNIANESAKIDKPNPLVSIFNFHYARPPKTVGLNYGLNKPIGDDETGFQGTGDFVYRAEAWEFLLAGGSLFNNLDYSFTIEHPDGSAKVVAPTPGGGGANYRKQIAYVKRLLEGFYLPAMKPDQAVVVETPPETTARALSQPSQAYLIYLKGKLKGKLTLQLPGGNYLYEWHNPRDCTHEPVSTHIEGGRVTIEVPAYTEDAALRIMQGGD